MFLKRCGYILIGLSVLSCGCSIQAQRDEKDREGMLNVSVLENEGGHNVYTAEYRDLSSEEVFTVSKEFLYKSAEQRLPSAGSKYTVTKMYKRNGDPVKEGDALLSVICEYDEMQKAAAEEALAGLNEAYEEKCGYYEELVAKAEAEFNASAKTELDRLKLDYSRYLFHSYDTVAKKEIAEAEQRLAEINDTGDGADIIICAQGTGIVSFPNRISVGRELWAGYRFCEITDTTRVIYTCDMGGNFLKAGEEITVSFGKTDVKLTVIDPGGRDTFSHEKTVLAVEAPGLEAAEMPDHFELKLKVTDLDNVLTVSEKAVRRDDAGRTYVLTEGKYGPEIKYVSIPGFYDGYAWIADGLGEGDVCIARS